MPPRAAPAMKVIERGEAAQPHFWVNFEQMGQKLAAFTPKRWELIGYELELGTEINCYI
jgi:hypothetical protein